MSWDDDDISLPWRMSVSVQNMHNRNHFKPTKYIKFKNDRITGIQETGVGHNMAAMSSGLWRQVKYKHMQSGQDQVIESAIKKTPYFCKKEIPDEQLYYVYRWAQTGSYHLSTWGWGKGFQQVDRYVKAHVKPGTYQLKPHWSVDYTSQFQEFIATRRSARARRVIRTRSNFGVVRK
jgi:hypothetical protein